MNKFKHINYNKKYLLYLHCIFKIKYIILSSSITYICQKLFPVVFYHYIKLIMYSSEVDSWLDKIPLLSLLIQQLV